MLLLFTDETNLEPAGGAKFFAYGGLLVDSDKWANGRLRLSAVSVRFVMSRFASTPTADGSWPA